jgi:hypothetical protein
MLLLSVYFTYYCIAAHKLKMADPVSYILMSGMRRQDLRQTQTRGRQRCYRKWVLTEVSVEVAKRTVIGLVSVWFAV